MSEQKTKSTDFSDVSINVDIENQQEITEKEDMNALNNPLGLSTKEIKNLKIILDESKHLPKASSDCRDMTFAIILITFALALLCGCVCYYVFGIMYLVEDYDEAKDCKKSNLWAYVLVNLILSFKNTQFKSNDDQKDNFLITLMCIGIIDAGMSIWGGIELFEYSCSDLENTNLFTFGLVTFILQTIVAGITLIIVPLSTCLIAICEK